MSSWNTMSDGPVEPNVRALSAMLDDAQSLLRLDTRRFYLAGFSGTARVAWAITPRLDSAVAGLLAAGAGTPVRAEWLAGPDAPRVAFFGTAGTTDFNFDEVMGLEPWLTAGNHTYALRSFDGGHQWPPETLFDDAITWFELQAMRAGRAELRQAFVDSLFIAWTARADSLATGASADRLHALDLYQEIARSFASVHQTESVTDRAATLREQDDVRAALQRRTELARESADYSTTFFRVMEQVSNSEGKPSADRIARDLDIERIIRERDAARTHDQRAVAQAAQRKLETVFVNTSFYSPQSFLRTNRPEYALAVLDVANRIYPDHPRVLHSRARARVMQGRADDALDDLEAAVRAGIPASALLDDPMLAPLRDHPRFRDLTAGG
jgi:tetratricopeptide (TPR) repeat protein